MRTKLSELRSSDTASILDSSLVSFSLGLNNKNKKGRQMILVLVRSGKKYLTFMVVKDFAQVRKKYRLLAIGMDFVFLHPP